MTNCCAGLKWAFPNRPYTDEYNFGMDRELMANVKLSAVYTYRREKNLQATANPEANVYATTPTSAVCDGPSAWSNWPTSWLSIPAPRCPKPVAAAPC